MTTSLPRLGRTPDGAYRVMDLLERGGYAPLLRGRAPLWQLPLSRGLADVVRLATIPTWRRWDRYAHVPDGAQVATCDVSGAYLAAASSTWVAHGPLEHTGRSEAQWRHQTTGEPMPGYYLVDRHHWGHSAEMPAPLGGGGGTATRAWVAAPTLHLLWQLGEEGALPEVDVLDSWTSRTRCRLSGRRTAPGWTDVVRDYRARFRRAQDGEAAESLKLGYAQAIQMMATPPDPRGTPAAERKKRNMTFRPDWYATIHAQHHATTWRRAWRSLLAGHGPVSAGSVDEVSWLAFDLVELTHAAAQPIRMDPTGIALGTLKIKRTWCLITCPGCGCRDPEQHSQGCTRRATPAGS